MSKTLVLAAVVGLCGVSFASGEPYGTIDNPSSGFRTPTPKYNLKGQSAAPKAEKAVVYVEPVADIDNPSTGFRTYQADYGLKGTVGATKMPERVPEPVRDTDNPTSGWRE